MVFVFNENLDSIMICHFMLHCRASVISFGCQSNVSASGYGPGSPTVPAVRESSLPSKKRPAKKARRGEDSSIDSALQGLIADHRRNQEKVDQLATSNDPDGDDTFLSSYGNRMKNLPAQTKSFLRLQIAQLFFNAENPDMDPIPVTPLPRITRTTIYPTQGQRVTEFEGGASFAAFSERGGTGSSQSSIIADAITISQVYQ